MFVRCPCGQKFYTSTAELHIVINDVMYVCPKCGGYIMKSTAKNLEVVIA